MNATDEVQNIKPFVPLDLFIHFYFNTFLKVSTLGSIINDVLPSVTCTAILSLIPRNVNRQTKLVAHIPVLKVTRSNFDSGIYFNLIFPVRLQQAVIISKKKYCLSKQPTMKAL